jgi:hypothetical protein
VTSSGPETRPDEVVVDAATHDDEAVGLNGDRVHRAHGRSQRDSSVASGLRRS